MRRLVVISTLLLVSAIVQAQFLEVVDIFIDGNKRTKERIIHRELDFNIGTRIQQSQLAERLERNEKLILRTGLFTYAKINVEDWNTDNDEIKLKIEVREGPTIIPFPIFELADRNFNVWWNEFNASFKRVNYGAQVLLVNPWGLGERFKISGQLGYTPKFDFSALLPFIDYNQSVRFEIDISYAQNREISMYNSDNKQIFLQKDGSTIFKRQSYSLALLVRQNLFTHHKLKIGFNNNWIDPQLTADVNPDYFLDARSRQEFISAEYEFTWDHRDLPVFPREGWRVKFKFKKDGFGFTEDISATYLSPLVEYNYPITNKLSIGTTISGQIALERNKQPYSNYRGLGYGDSFIRGYELYVIDGLDFFVVQNMVSYRILSSAINWNKLMPVKSLRVMPLQLYVSAHYDAGYVNDPFYYENNSYTNSWNYGWGLALNVLMYNTFALRIEGSITKYGDKGIFFHSNTVF